MNEPGEELSDVSSPLPQHGDGSEILCVCFGVTKNDVHDHMARPNCSVDDMISATRIGTKCTACLLDLDITLNDIQQSRDSGTASKDTKSVVEIGPGDSPVEHLDSAFFVCADGVKTVLRIANFTPMFEPGLEAVDHTYTIWLMDEGGRIASRTDGLIGANAQIEVDFSQIDGCPPRGWFLISCFPKGAGFYGTLRPQALLVGEGWASSYHVQPQYAASNKYRRLSIVVKSTDHKTNNSVFIFNGERRKGSMRIEIDSRESDFHAECSAFVEANGMCVVDVDKEFPSLPESEIMLLTVESDTITKKYLAAVQPDGQWSADHFPTLP